MGFLRRLSFFLFGSSIGLILIFAFFGKKVFFESYFPNKRVLNSIKKKEIIFEFSKSELSEKLKKYYDLSFITSILLEKGEIFFSKSQPRKKPFPLYLIRYKDLKEKIDLYFYIENQDSKALIKNINKK